MNWSKTKTIFIICFLLLDIFLAYQMYDRQRESKKQLENFATDTIDIKNQKVRVKAELPDVENKVYFLTGAFVDFDDVEVKKGLKALEGGSKLNFTTSDNGRVLIATFKKPIKIPKTTEDQQTLLKKYMYRGGDYSYYPLPEDNRSGVLHFIQTFNGTPIFSVAAATGELYTLDVYTDGKNITGYKQVLLQTTPGELVSISKKPEEAINILSETNNLPITENPVIDTVELGYINTSSDINGDQKYPYIPAWYIGVKTDKGEKAFFVTMDGRVIPFKNGKEGAGVS